MAVIDTQFATPAPKLVTSTRQPIERVGTISLEDAPIVHAGSQIVHARSEDGLLTWSYTAGLRHAYNHPEFLLTGLDTFLAESVLAPLIAQVADGQVFTEATAGRDLLHRLTCAFREVPAAMVSILMPMADTMQNGQVLSALQCVYPDNKNRLPWHFGYNDSWHEVQPIFNLEWPLNRVEINMLRAAAGIPSKPAAHTLEELF